MGVIGIRNKQLDIAIQENVTARKSSLETKLTVDQIQVAISEIFGVRDNIIVPNVSWGFFETHEADLVVINKSNYLTEIEIKRSWSDFIKDFRKTTTHDEVKVMYKFFALPQCLLGKARTYLEENDKIDWGIIVYSEEGYAWIEYYPSNHGQSDSRKKLYIEERLSIARLGCMRIWKLKTKLNKSNIDK